MASDKEAVRAFWDRASCGEELYLQSQDIAGFGRQRATRYALEPYILEFADFAAWSGKDVLEIGVGLGADHQGFAEAGARLTGVDITERAVANTRRRFELLGLRSDLRTADAEALPFADDSFDLVYSWGVLHHTPDTPRAIEEVRRVLKPGGRARIMIYHSRSMVGLMLWIRYGLLAGRPFTSLKTIYAEHLESPGTKAYTVDEAARLFSGFSSSDLRTVLTHGDLLESEAGQRHRGILLTVARRLWPRWLIRRWFPRHGLFLLVSATK